MQGNLAQEQQKKIKTLPHLHTASPPSMFHCLNRDTVLCQDLDLATKQQQQTWLEKPRATHLSPGKRGSHKHFPYWSQCSSWPDTWFLCSLEDILRQQNHQGTLKNKSTNEIYYSQVLEGTGHAWNHTARRQIEKRSPQAWGSAFIRGQGRISRISQLHSFLGSKSEKGKTSKQILSQPESS